MESSAGNETQTTGRRPRNWRGTPGPRGAGFVPDARPAEGHRRAATVRVLIAIEDRHRIFREAIERFFRVERSGFEVRLTKPRALYSELRRFGPQVVLYAGPPTPVPDLLPCFVEISLDPDRPTVLRTGRARREVLNPSLSALLEMIEEAAPVCR